MKAVRNKKGFTVLETLVTTFIITLASLTFSNSFIQHSQNLTFAETNSEAIIAAQRILDLKRLEDPSTFPDVLASDSPVAVSVGNSDYDVTVTYCSNSSYCPPTTSTETRHIKVLVEHKSEVVYEVETVFTKLN